MVGRRAAEFYCFLMAGCLLVLWLLPDLADGKDQAPAAGAKTMRYGQHANLVDVYMPEADGKGRPAVLLIHGGGWSAGSRSEFADWGRALASQGIVAASIDYRLTSAGHRWPAQAEDVEQAMWWLREQADELGIDPKRIAVIGGSAGAHLAAWLATGDRRSPRGASSRPTAVVALWGPWDLTQSRVTLSRDANNIIDSLVDGGQGRREASPFYRISAETSPTLIFHGQKDVLVPHIQSVRACDTIKAAGASCELVLFEEEAHEIRNPRNADMLMTKTTAFLKATLYAN